MRETSFGESSNKIFEKILFLLRARHILKELNSLSKPVDIADIGCGYNANFLTNAIKNSPLINKGIGIDLSVTSRFIDEKIQLIKGDLNEKLPLGNEKFDLVFSTAVLEHLKNPDQALAEMHRILKKNGRLVLTTPSPAAKPVLEFLAYKLGFLDEQEVRDHKKYFSKEDLRSSLEGAGFKNINIKSFQFGFNSLAICDK